MEFIDAHGHIYDERYEDVSDIVKKALEKGVCKIVCPSSDLSTATQSIQLANEFSNVYANVGIHPETFEELDEKSLAEIEKLANNEKVVAIGEIGLDYHTRTDKKEEQKFAFIKQIEIANKLNKPIVVHSREAMGDTIDVLRNHTPNKPSLMHCFNGSLESAEILMKLGFSFSFGGLVTFKNAKSVVEVVKNLPLDRILLETDCPYMTPEPFRGKRNEPSYVVYTADRIAKIKGISIEEVARVTTENAKRLFGI